MEKEQLLAERFWAKHAMHDDEGHDGLPFSGGGMSMLPYGNLKDFDTCSSIAPTYVSDLTADTTSTEVKDLTECDLRSDGWCSC